MCCVFPSGYKIMRYPLPSRRVFWQRRGMPWLLQDGAAEINCPLASTEQQKNAQLSWQWEKRTHNLVTLLGHHLIIQYPQPAQLPRFPLAQGVTQREQVHSAAFLEAWAGRNQLFMLGSSSRLWGNAEHSMKLLHWSSLQPRADHPRSSCLSEPGIAPSPARAASEYWKPPEADKEAEWNLFLFIYTLNPSQHLFPESFFANQLKFQLMRPFLTPSSRRSWTF